MDLAVHGVVHLDGHGREMDFVDGECHTVLGEGLTAAQGDRGILVVHIEAELPMSLHHGNGGLLFLVPDAQVLKFRRGSTSGDGAVGADGLHQMDGAGIGFIRYKPGAAVAAAADI